MCVTVRSQIIELRDEIISDEKTLKVDTILRKSKNDIDVPNTWKTKMDGKKVVLLNTHLRGITDCVGNFLDNIQYIFSVVEGMKESVVLLWCTSPLAMDIFSYTPKEQEQYRRITDMAKNSDYIIYDDTRNIERALVLADMYIDDRSSFASLYAFLGKPIFIYGNENLRYKERQFIEKKFGFSMDCGCCVDGKLWFVPRNINGLFKMSLEGKEVSYVACFEEEDCLQDDLFIEIICFDGELWFFPCSARKIYVWNLQKKEWRKLDIPLDIEGMKFLFGAVFQIGVKVYLLPHSVEKGIVVDMEMDIVETAEGFIPIENEGEKQEKYERCCCGEEKVYAAYKGTNYVIEFDKRTNQAAFHRAGNETEKYNVTAVGEQNLFLFPVTGGDVSLYTKGYEFIRRKQLIEDVGVQATSALAIGQDVWVAYMPNIVARWDLTNDTVETWKLPEEYRNPDVGVTYGAYGPGRILQMGGEIICLPGDYGIMMRYDRQKNEMQKWFADISWEWVRSYVVQKHSDKGEFLLRLIPVRDFIQYGTISCENDEKSEQTVGEMFGDFGGNVGENIVRKLLTELY